MPWNSLEFMDQLNACGNRYEQARTPWGCSSWGTARYARIRRCNDMRRDGPGLRDAPAMQGPGSILSEISWTPLLNDSFILGGAHGGHEFHLALEDVAVVPTTKTLAQIFASLPESDPKAKWQAFFNGQPGILWDQKLNAPRVLVRELIGLKACGYRASFQPLQLSFVATRMDSSTTFTTYLNSLGAEGYSNKNRTIIFNALSLFLFQKSGMFRES
jgi:hypothetical protein